MTIGSCKKDNNEINANFKCKLDGTAWNAYSDDLKLSVAEAHLTNGDKEIFIKARNTKSREEIGFGIYTSAAMITPGRYALIMPTVQFGYYSKNDFKGEYKTKAGYEGELEIISLDKSAKRVSGKFRFKCLNETTLDASEITEGEFNLAYFDF